MSAPTVASGAIATPFEAEAAAPSIAMWLQR